MDFNSGMLAAIIDGNAKILLRLEHSIGLQDESVKLQKAIIELLKNNVGANNNIALDNVMLDDAEFDLIDNTDDINDFETKLSDREFNQTMVSCFWPYIIVFVY